MGFIAKTKHIGDIEYHYGELIIFENIFGNIFYGKFVGTIDDKIALIDSDSFLKLYRKAPINKVNGSLVKSIEFKGGIK